jgi:hypothetical protein
MNWPVEAALVANRHFVNGAHGIDGFFRPPKNIKLPPKTGAPVSLGVSVFYPVLHWLFRSGPAVSG